MFNDGGTFPELWAPPRAPPEPAAPLRSSSRWALGLGAATGSTDHRLTGSREECSTAEGKSWRPLSPGRGGLVSEDVMGSHSLVDKVELVGKIFCINI